MRRWTLPLLSALMLAIAIALSTPFLRLNANTKLQALKVSVPNWATGVRLYQTRFGNGIQRSSASTSQHPIAQTSSSPTNSLQQPLDQTRTISSHSTTAVTSDMASTCPLPEGSPTEQKASVAAADTLASKSAAEPELPKLSAQDFRVYNRLATMMDAYVRFSPVVVFQLPLSLSLLLYRTSGRPRKPCSTTSISLPHH